MSCEWGPVTIQEELRTRALGSGAARGDPRGELATTAPAPTTLPTLLPPPTLTPAPALLTLVAPTKPASLSPAGTTALPRILTASW